MKNSNNKNILLIFIIVVFILFASFITFLFLNKDIQLNQNVDSTKESTDKIEDSIIIDQEKNVVIKSKLIDKNGEKFNYVTIEYTPNNSAESYILKTFYDNKFSLDATGPESEQFLDKYEIAYLSNKYLAVGVTGGYEGISSDLLFNLSTLREEKPSIDEPGTYKFFDNDKYVIFRSIPGISESFGGKDFITVEVVNGESIDFVSPTLKCILTEKPTTDDITIKDGLISFTEITYSEDGKEVKTEKNININDFCKK
jgi:hypothetical protein